MSRQKRTAEQISSIMRRVKSTNTSPELRFKRTLLKHKVRFKYQAKTLPGKPDFVIPNKKVAMFVDGDFWHGNQWKLRNCPSLQMQFKDSNGDTAYWVNKLLKNRRRDFINTSTLLDSGWKVVRIWESTIKSDLEQCEELALRSLRHTNISDGAFPELARLTVAEFFAGIGLVRLALEKSGWKTVFANDIDNIKQTLYEKNFGGNEFVLGDIHKLPSDLIPPCALFTASFPCNDLSVAGARRGLAGLHSGAFWGLIRILREMRGRKPPLIMLENVPGFLTSHGGKDFEAALVALNNLGYGCDALVINASNFVPQSRARLFVIGKLGEPQNLNAIREFSDCRPDALIEFIKTHKNIVWNLRKLPNLPTRNTSLQQIVEDIPHTNPIWWSRDRVDYFMGQLSNKHSTMVRHLIRHSNYSYLTAFRRIRHGKSMAELRFDGIAGCLRTPRGGSGRQILLKVGYGKYWVRLLTPRECARLQGVDDAFKIGGSLNQALFGFGDAVCVPVIEWISDNYLIPVASEMIRGRILAPSVR